LRIAGVTLLAVFLAASAAEQAPPRPPAFEPGLGALLPENRVPELVVSCNPGGVPIEGYWSPGAKQIAELERRLAFELDAALRKDRPANAGSVDQYYRQYGGFVLAGRRLICVNAFLAPEEPPAWRKQPLLHMEVGASAWRAAYDPDRRTFVEYRGKDDVARTIRFSGAPAADGKNLQRSH
jgi:hypothetical protein